MARLVFFICLMFCFIDNAASENIVRIDLSSETAWSLRIDGGTERPIKVPYGGWNSDRQPLPQIKEDRDVNDCVIYKRQIEIPTQVEGNVVVIYFGAVNYGAEVFLDGRLVGKHDSPFTAFEADLTSYVKGGRSYILEVKAFHINHYNTKNREMLLQGKRKESLEKGNIRVPTGFLYYDGQTKFPFGICRAIELRVYPAVYIKDVFIQPSVTDKSLVYDVWIENRSAENKQVKLASVLNSWNGDKWCYPIIPETMLEIPRGKVQKFTIGSVEWKLGNESYWWPNIPFRENYKAKLHSLKLTLSEGSRQWDAQLQRFGFVEHKEGPYYYTINGVRVNLPSDATAITQGCVYDGYAEGAAFRPPTTPGTGCPETWKRYMRMGIRANRTHQEPPTEYMMSVADEVGFILIPESAIRGSYLPQSYEPNIPSYEEHLREMVQQCRNHPCVARYSLSNEMGAPPEYIDYAVPHDPTRPYVYESNTHSSSTRIQTKNGHAYTTAHYCDWPRPAREIFAMGEYAWSTDGMADYATQGKSMRLNDVCYFSGWSWSNYWPNFLEGMENATYAWKPNNHPDRKDGIDGWDSPLIKYVQKSLHPYAIMDHEIERLNTYSDDWPAGIPTIMPGCNVTRRIEIFNDALFGNELAFKWVFKWDSPTGEIIGSGSKDLKIEPGFHKTENISFTVPKIASQSERKLYLLMETFKDGNVVFKEDRIHFRVSDLTPSATAIYVDEDSQTKGDWRGKYGNVGYDIAGAQKDLPGYATIKWEPDNVYIRQSASKDSRMLQYFVNDGLSGVSRIAASRDCYGTVQVAVDVGEREHYVSLYFVDWDGGTGPQTIVIPEAGIEHKIENFKSGKYVIFKVRGKVKFVITAGRVSTISGIFLDSVDKMIETEKKVRIDDRDGKINPSSAVRDINR